MQWLGQKYYSLLRPGVGLTKGTVLSVLGSVVPSVKKAVTMPALVYQVTHLLLTRISCSISKEDSNNAGTGLVAHTPFAHRKNSAGPVSALTPLLLGWNSICVVPPVVTVFIF